MEPTKEQILNAIKKSGYLFEQEVATIIESQDFHIQTNTAFKDLDEEKSREIDVIAFKRYYHDEDLKISVGIRILCECKNNINPFIFISRNKNKIDELYSPPNFLFPKDEYYEAIPGKEKSFYNQNGFKYFKLDEIYPFSKAKSKSVQFSKLIPRGKDWIAEHEHIYDSLILPITKCLEYYKQKDKSIKSDEWKNYMIYFPIVVLNSKLYNIDSSKDAEKVEEVEYITFTREIESSKQKNRYLIDFITKENLAKYVTEYVDEFVYEFIEKIKKNIDFYR